MVCCTPRFLLSAIVGIFAAASLSALETDLNTLLQNSPFGNTTRATPQSNEPVQLEFRGVMSESGTSYFSIYEPTASRSAWVRLNEKSAQDYVVESYDASNRQLKVKYQGQTLTLTLSSTVSRVSSGPTGVQQQNNLSSAPTATPKPAVMASEAERLSKIASEIKRRRALRQQAIKKTNLR